MRSIIQCPHCGFKTTESIASIEKENYHCVACLRKITVTDGSCCIICEYGSVPCGLANKNTVKGNS